MKFATQPIRAAKGRLRCFDCRKPLSMKEGDWHERGNQQVFLCHPCNKVHQDSRLKNQPTR